MIQQSDIRNWADTFLVGTAGFIVDIKVSDGNQIKVLLDNDGATSIEQCMALSRHIESFLDREQDDFRLDVSSPGLDMPLQLERQYQKNIGKQIIVKPTIGVKIEGELVAIHGEGLTLKTREKRRIEGRKAKEWVEEEQGFSFNELDYAKVLISFK